MKVKIHTLFQYLLETTEADPEAIVGEMPDWRTNLNSVLDQLGYGTADIYKKVS